MPTQTPTDPSLSPTNVPSDPTNDPSYHPTRNPSNNPTGSPTNIPSEPTNNPSIQPSYFPSEPTDNPTYYPTDSPSYPTLGPSEMPVFNPTNLPSISPTFDPSNVPTRQPTGTPIGEPTNIPTTIPTTDPTAVPTEIPTKIPTEIPTDVPTKTPTIIPTGVPTTTPTTTPSVIPTNDPATQPTTIPTDIPTKDPLTVPTAVPTKTPSQIPTNMPTTMPSIMPTNNPTTEPTTIPSQIPTNVPTQTPRGATSNYPTTQPTKNPRGVPTITIAPSLLPSNEPSITMTTSAPTSSPATAPTNTPTTAPTNASTSVPTSAPTNIRTTGIPTHVPTSTRAPTAPSLSPIHIPTYVPTNVTRHEVECIVDGNMQTVDWENLLFSSNNDGIRPNVDVAGFISDNTLGVEITVSADYVVTSKYQLLSNYYQHVYQSTQHAGNLPITYLLTFDEFNDFTNNNNNNNDQLDEPGSCNNRERLSYAGYNTSEEYIYDYWTFTSNPVNSNGEIMLGNDHFMEYPISNVWNITFTVAQNDTKCGTVTWKTKLTLSDMLNVNDDGCSNKNGESVFTFIDDNENGAYKLQGIFYMYFVSPDPLLFNNYETRTIDEMQSNYLHHALVTYPISLHFAKMSSYEAVIDDIVILGSMVGNTVYGTSFDDLTGILNIDLLTWCPKFMIYTLEPGFHGFEWLSRMPNGTNATFVEIEAIYGNSCLTISFGRCFQKFRINIEIFNCDSESGFSLNNEYILWTTSQPANMSSNSDITNWMDLIGVSSLNGTKKSLFFDVFCFDYFESCETFSFNFDFNHNITFYDDDTYSRESLISSNNPLFVSNSGIDEILYVEIEVGSLILTDLTDSNIVDMSILDIWFCVYNSNNSNYNYSSCFENTNGDHDHEIWYLYSTTSSTTDDGYMTSDDIVDDLDNNLLEQFSFVIPMINNANSDTFGVQISVQLSVVQLDSTPTTTATTVRRLLNGDDMHDPAYNHLSQTYNTGSLRVGISDNDDENNNGGNLFDSKNGWLYYIIMAIMSLFVIACSVIVCLLMKSNKNKHESIDEINQFAHSMEIQTKKVNDQIKTKSGHNNNEILNQFENDGVDADDTIVYSH